MRRVSRSGLLVLAATGSLLVASTATGQDGGAGAAGAAGAGGTGPVAPCDPNTLWCSNGAMQQVTSSNDRLPGDIDTGWIPSCSSGTDHCDDEKIQIRAQIAFDPTKTGGPLYTIDMKKGTMVDARWPETDWIDLTVPPGGQTDGTFKVAHTMTPEIALYIDTPVYTGEITLDASTLINYLPGAQFQYYAMGSTKFRPWGFDPVTLNVKGTDLSVSKLFGITFDQIADILGANGIDDYVAGEFTFNATSDTDFIYTTTQVVVTGATGPINYADGMVQVMSPDGDYLELLGHAVGIMRYDSTIKLFPVITIDSIGGVGVNLNFPVGSLGYEFEFGSGSFPVTFPNELVHIPLPNVFVPSTPVNFGTVATGGKSDDRTVLIENTGELGAILEFSSSDNQFKFGGASAAEMGPSAEHELVLRFQPTKSGKQEATITVSSNDPDTPIQTFTVSGFGEGEDIPDPEDGGTAGTGGGSNPTGPSAFDDSGEDGGCGCRTPSTQGGAAGASLALLGLAVAMMRRRRR